MSADGERFLRCDEVVQMVSLSRASLYRLMRSGEFPEPIKLGQRAVRWREAELREFLATRPRATGNSRADCHG